jgi:hypothetical protein
LMLLMVTWCQRHAHRNGKKKKKQCFSSTIRPHFTRCCGNSRATKSNP